MADKRNTKSDSSNNKARSSLRSNDGADGDGGGNGEGMMMMMMMASWPPRCYTCSFCKREFRSAQALGGHMNVHRRDRAHLTQLGSVISLSSTSAPAPTNTHHTTSINLNLPPNPTPTPNHMHIRHMLLSPPTIQSSKNFGCRFMSNPQSSYSASSTCCRETPASPNLDGANRTHQQCSYHTFNTTSGFITLDLEMNIHPHPPIIHQDLDLELRLGCN